MDEFCYIYTAEASEKEKRRNEVMNVVENEMIKRLSQKFSKKEEMLIIMLKRYEKLECNVGDFEKDCHTFFANFY